MSCSLFPPNTPLRTKIGVALTAVYLLGLISLINWKWANLIGMELNNLGDFAAGAFGPLAFLWLVIGYMQQGDELKQNTDALRLQADELANTVQQQKELVALGHQQLEREKQLIQEERARKKAAARPRFELSTTGRVKETDGWLTLDIDVRSVGPNCTNVRVSTNARGLYVSLVPNIPSPQFWRVTARGVASEPFETFNFYVEYIDIDGETGRQIVNVSYYAEEDCDGYDVYGEDDERLSAVRLKADTAQQENS